MVCLVTSYDIQFILEHDKENKTPIGTLSPIIGELLSFLDIYFFYLRYFGSFPVTFLGLFDPHIFQGGRGGGSMIRSLQILHVNYPSYTVKTFFTNLPNEDKSKFPICQQKFV